MGSSGMPWHHDCNPMGDVAKISASIPSTPPQNAILSLLIIHMIPSHQIYLAMAYPSLMLSICCLTTSRYPRNYLRAADNSSHTAFLPSYIGQWFSHLYKFWDRIQVTG